jgi:hypothetical protein
MKGAPAFSMKRIAKACAIVLQTKFMLNSVHYAAAIVTRMFRWMDRRKVHLEILRKMQDFRLGKKLTVTFLDGFLAFSDFKRNLESQ